MNTIQQKRIDKVAAAIAPFNRMSQKRDYFVKGATFALAHQWISVDEELPKCCNKNGTTNIVLAKSDLGDKFLAYYDYSNEHWYHNYEAIYDKEIYSKITHWMEIPTEGGEE